jgi:hypothetical protein
VELAAARRFSDDNIDPSLFLFTLAAKKPGVVTSKKEAEMLELGLAYNNPYILPWP